MSPQSLQPEQHRPRNWITPYFASFNGLRGLAILAVFLRHYGILALPFRWVYGLWSGVDLFFVLSGFLITGILFDTLHEPHFFRNFYIRRALRIFPLYYGGFLLLLLAALLLPNVHFSPWLWSYALYVGNLILPFSDLTRNNPTTFFFDMFGRHEVISIGPFWSLCVEEQFYLLWPLIVFTVRSRARLMHLAAYGCAAALLLRAALFCLLPEKLLTMNLIYNSTYTRFDTLLVGAWCALWLRGARPSPAQLKRICYTAGLPCLATLLIGVLLTIHRWPDKSTNPFLATIGFSLIAVVSAAILLRSLDETSWTHKLTRIRWVASLGVVSYGFYILHALPILPLERFLQWHTFSPLQFVPIVLAIGLVTFFAAKLSFHFYEARFLKLKHILAPSPHSGPPLQQELADTDVAVS